MQVFNLILVILIIFILFNQNFDKEMENIKEQENNKNNKGNTNKNNNKNNNKNINSSNQLQESFSNSDEMDLTVEKESNSIGTEIKKSIINTFIISQERITKSVGKFDMLGRKKLIRAAFSVKPPDEFQMMEMENKELEKKIKNAADKNQIQLKIDGKITKTEMVSKIKSGVLYVNLLMHIS